ncbi:MAG TPA: hypothetical protein VJ508_01265, partial [Saprospiraceae bacterium]|nr:hypothetical protein [Saprospiraceae bacterium]
CTNGSVISPEYKRPSYVIHIFDHSEFKGFVCRKWGVHLGIVSGFTLVNDSVSATKFSIPADAAQFADEIRVRLYPFIPVVWDLNANKEVGPDPTRGG